MEIKTGIQIHPSKMKIEEEIKQAKFKSEYQKLSINLLFTANWLENRHREFMKEYGVTIQQFNLLRILRGQYPKPVSVSLIRERMIDKMSDVSRIVERLRQSGLLNRSECSKDRRLVDVIISDKGLTLLSVIDKKMDELDNIVDKLSVEEADLMNKMLDKIRED